MDDKALVMTPEDVELNIRYAVGLPLREVLTGAAATAEIQTQSQAVQLATQTSPVFGIDGGVEELPEVENFFPQFQFRRKAIRVFQNLVG